MRLLGWPVLAVLALILKALRAVRQVPAKCVLEVPRVDRTELKVGEALTLTLSLTGAGYIKGAAHPRLPELSDFRVHDSGASADGRPSGGRLEGRLVVVRRPGRF